MAELWCWRHPRATGAAGRCIGRTDLAVDRRKAKRLAHRIRAAARRHGLPREIWVSPLQRALCVGRWLQRWGWQLQVDERLCEMDFGGWDGRPWRQIEWTEVQAWESDFLQHAPGGGESLAALGARVRAFVAEAGERPRLVVGHGGWINAWLHLAPQGRHVDAANWPAGPPHGSLQRAVTGA